MSERHYAVLRRFCSQLTASVNIFSIVRLLSVDMSMLTLLFGFTSVAVQQTTFDGASFAYTDVPYGISPQSIYRRLPSGSCRIKLNKRLG
jgi:hypothetical protein